MFSNLFVIIKCWSFILNRIPLIFVLQNFNLYKALWEQYRAENLHKWDNKHRSFSYEQISQIAI